MKDWLDYYTPRMNRIHPTQEFQFETYGDDLEYVKDFDQNYVWTVTDDDSGNLSIHKGFHYVNRLYYVISKESHEDDDEVYEW